MVNSGKGGPAIFIFILLTVLALLLYLATSPSEMSRYNHEWNGTSRLFALAEDAGAIEIREPTQLEPLSSGILLIVAPRGPYTGAAISAYRNFHSRGGTILIAGEDEETNLLLSLLGSRMRVQEGRLCSVDTASSSTSTPIALRAGEEWGIPAVERLTLNRPLAVEGGKPLLKTSILSWRDLDMDGRIGANETLMSHPVLAYEKVMAGHLYLLGDVSIFINGMLESGERGGSAEFVVALLERGAMIDQIVSATGKGDGAIGILEGIKRGYMPRMVIISVILLLFGLLWWRMGGNERRGR